MADMKFALKEYQELRYNRAVIDHEWQRLAEYLLPNLSNISKFSYEGGKKTKQLYDTTGIDAADKLVSLIIGTATSSVVRWFSLKHRNTEVNLFPEVQFWLEDTAQRMFDAINNSNYKTAAAEVIREITVFGTGNLFVSEMEPAFNPRSDFRGLFFQGVPIGTYTIQENAIGTVDKTAREFRVAAGSLLERWPKGEYSKNTRDMIKNKPWERVSILHDVRPSTIKGQYLSQYMLMHNTTGLIGTPVAATHAEPLAENRFFEMPHLVPRWDKVTGEIWGFGRGHLALPEIATLNRARQLKLRQWALSVHPPIIALDDGVINKPKIIPGHITRVRVDGALKPFETGVNFNHNLIVESESKLQIRQIFFTEQILQFAPNAKTPPTATEVIQRMEFLHQLLGPSLGRLQDELLSRMLIRVFQVMMRAGAFLPMPEILATAGGALEIEYEGPLARAQRGDELRAMNDTMTMIGNIVSLTGDVSVWDNYDLDTWSRDVSRVTGSSKRYLRDPADRDARREERAQAQAAAQAQASALADSETAKNFGQAQAAAAKGDIGAMEANVQ